MFFIINLHFELFNTHYLTPNVELLQQLYTMIFECVLYTVFLPVLQFSCDVCVCVRVITGAWSLELSDSVFLICPVHL